MTAPENVVPFPKRTRFFCSKCGAKGEMGCGCGVEYIKAAEFAARAVAANPEKSNRAIAKEAGVSFETVRRARAKSTDTNVSVEKRTGRDGKKRRAPRPQPDGIQKQRSINMRPEEWQEFKAKAEAEGVAVAAKIGEVLRRDIEGPAVDPASLPATMQAKLDAAERQMRRRLEDEFAARTADFDERVRLAVVGQNKEYLTRLNRMEEEAEEAKSTYREFMAKQKKMFSKAEFMLILMCVHADPSITKEKRDEATRLLLGNRFAMTGEK